MDEVRSREHLRVDERISYSCYEWMFFFLEPLIFTTSQLTERDDSGAPPAVDEESLRVQTKTVHENFTLLKEAFP